ncbi:MAG: hypothetical protein PWQ48_110 [Thermotogaceae bacterium]|nr:hypothetical protein [Thermotogaceae bacterium]
MSKSFVMLMILVSFIVITFSFSAESHTMKMILIPTETNIATETFSIKDIGSKSFEVTSQTVIDINYQGTVYKAEYLTAGNFDDFKVESYSATITATNGNFYYFLNKVENGFEIYYQTPVASNKKVFNTSEDLYLLDNNIMWNWFLIIKVLEKSKENNLKVVIPQLSSHPMIDIPVFDLKVLDEYSEDNYKFYILSLVNSQIIVKIDETGKITEILQGAFKVTQSN